MASLHILSPCFEDFVILPLYSPPPVTHFISYIFLKFYNFFRLIVEHDLLLSLVEFDVTMLNRDKMHDFFFKYETKCKKCNYAFRKNDEKMLEAIHETIKSIVYFLI